MTIPAQALRHEYLRHNKKFPHVWCPGCGNGIVMGSLLRAISSLKLDKDEVVLVSGIGCSGRMPTYLDFNTLHTTHGRALTFATGVKLAKPELNVVAIMGDGDATAIGGNHFIHAARRNVDLTVICVNNFNYGMTGGQVAATTPHMAKTTTTPVGNPDTPFNLPLLAYASGATYVARWTILHTRDLTESIEEALLNRGFSFIEILSPCPVNYGRRNKENGIDSLKIYQERTIIRNDAQPWELDIDFDRGIVLGKFIQTERPTCTDRYDNTCRPKELIEGEKGLE